MRNRISFLAFLEQLEVFGVFSTQDIYKAFPHFDSRRLVEWQAKNYLQKLSNKWYCFAKMERSEFSQFRVANLLCKPSYISLESAFDYYGLIPESTFSSTSVTTKKTSHFENDRGNFTYRSIKNSLFFGYKTLYTSQEPVLMAEPEKAILDYLYLHPEIQTVADMEALRFNADVLEGINWEKFVSYLSLFKSRALEKRVLVFKQTYHYAQL
jgi:predicted transcriptional regulator of viral defense system